MTEVRDRSRPFLEVFEALDPKAHRRALRSAMRREGNNLKRIAVAQIGSSGLGKGSRAKVAKGVRVRTFPDRYGAGFMLTVKPHGKKGYHKNRQGHEKPVLMWAEDGTRPRYTKSKTRFFVRIRKGHFTGRMKAYRFLKRTEDTGTPQVERGLFDTFRQNLDKEARKRGL